MFHLTLLGYSITLAIAWYLSIWTVNHSEFSTWETKNYFIYGLLILMAHLAVYFGVMLTLNGRKSFKRMMACVLSGIFSAIYLFSIKLIHYDLIAGYNTIIKILIVILLAVIFSIVCRLLTQSAKVRVFLGIFIAAFLLQTATDYLWSERKRNDLVAAASKFPEYIKFPEFTKKPNVYIISFDSMIPESVASKLLGIESLGYISVIDEYGYRRLKNVFSERTPTKPYFNSLVAMDAEYFRSVPKSARFLFATGEILGPLYTLFKKNDYKTQFLYASTYFGIPKRAGVDFYGYDRYKGICNHIDSPMAFVGYCVKSVSRMRRKGFKVWDKILGNKSVRSGEVILDRIKFAGESSDPWFTLAHIYAPGHVPKGYDGRDPEDFEKYKSDFIKRRLPNATMQIKEVLDTLRQHDPEAIVILFGDHGTFVTRRVKSTGGARGDVELSAKDVYLDRHAVVGAIYPPHFCEQEFGSPFSTIRAGRALAKCLSDGSDVFPASYQENDDHLMKYKYE